MKSPEVTFSILLILSIILEWSSSTPLQPPSDEIALSQSPGPTMIGVKYVFRKISSRLKMSVASVPYDSVNNSLHSSTNAIFIHTAIRNTHMEIGVEDDARRMPYTAVSQILQGANANALSLIAQHGGETPLLEAYSFVRGELCIEAWQYISEEHYKVTYDTLFDMITGLERNLARLNDRECSVALEPVIEGLPREAGNGVIGFVDKSAPTLSNQTLSSFLKTTNDTLGVSQIRTRIRDTAMTLQQYGRKRKMSLASISAILTDAYSDVRHQILHYGEDTTLSEEYQYILRGLKVAAWSHRSPRETKYQVTYGMVCDMIAGLRANLRQLDDVECAVDLAKVVGNRIYPAGSGVLV